MLNIRNGIFETNSSSTHSLVVSLIQIDGLEIPSTVDIESGHFPLDNNVHGCYTYFKEKGREKQFFGFLLSKGVKQIYVDGIPVKADSEDRDISMSFSPEELLSKCFGLTEYFFESSAWGGGYDELDTSKDFSYSDFVRIERYEKDPRYKVTYYNSYDEECSKEEFVKEHKYMIDLGRNRARPLDKQLTDKINEEKDRENFNRQFAEKLKDFNI